MLSSTAYCSKCKEDEFHSIRDVSNGEEWTCTKCGYTRTYSAFVVKPTSKLVKMNKEYIENA